MEENKENEVKEEVGKVEPKKKGSFGKVLFVLILMVACLCGGYYLCAKDIVNIDLGNSDKKEVNEKKEKTTKTEKTECEEATVYAITDEKVSGLIENIVQDGKCQSAENFLNDKKVTASDITNDSAYFMVQWKYYNAGQTEISGDEFTKEVQKLLGKDYQFKPETVNYNSDKCPAYKYDANSSKFIKQETACGWTCGPRTSYQLVKAVEENGILELDVKAVFFNEKDFAYYGEYAKTTKLTDNMEAAIPYAKGTTYRFTFKNVDGDYAFVSSEPVK